MHENVAVALQVICRCWSEILASSFGMCLCSVEFLLLFHLLFILFFYGLVRFL